MSTQISPNRDFTVYMGSILQAIVGPNGKYFANIDGDNQNKYHELVNQDINDLVFEFEVHDQNQRFRFDLIEFCYSYCK